MNYGEGGLSASDVALLNRSNDGFGDGNGAWWIILFLIFGFGRGGYGFGGSEGGVMNNYVLNSDFATIERKLDGVNNGLCSGFYQEAQLINGIDKTILTTGNGISSQLADVGYGIKDCCCQQLRAIDGINFNNAQNTCNIVNTINTGLKDVMFNCNNNYQKLHEEIVANKLEAKNDRIAEQQNEINALRLSASQCSQNQYLIDKLQYPKIPVPAYTVANPYCNCNSCC